MPPSPKERRLLWLFHSAPRPAFPSPIPAAVQSETGSSAPALVTLMAALGCLGMCLLAMQFHCPSETLSEAQHRQRNPQVKKKSLTELSKCLVVSAHWWRTLTLWCRHSHQVPKEHRASDAASLANLLKPSSAALCTQPMGSCPIPLLHRTQVSGDVWILSMVFPYPAGGAGQ